jgi:hypothetical protein
VARDIEKIWVHRIIPIQNLEKDLRKGLFAKNHAASDPTRVIIGNKEIIGARDQWPVKCYSPSMVNDYVPFYFSVRTPMLYNIHTGMGVEKRPQSEIVYLSCRLVEI